MPTQTIRALIRLSRWAELKSFSGACSAENLAAAWPGLEALERLIVFRLLPDEQASRLYDALGAAEKYFLLCGLEAGSLAPVLENSSARERGLFVERAAPAREAMLARLEDSFSEKTACLS